MSLDQANSGLERAMQLFLYNALLRIFSDCA